MYIKEMTYFYEFYVYEVNNIQEELVSAFCFEHGASGISENLKFQQNFENYESQTIPTEFHNLVVYFETQPPPFFLNQFKEDFPDIFFELKEQKNKDWLEEWKKGFHAFSLIENIWVVPSWEEGPKESQKNIKIDPGMAFGTGTHDTTKIASKLIYDLMKDSKIHSVLDVGTGTGILAMLTEYLGAELIQGTEIDKDAREVAKKNIVLNHCQNIEILENQIDKVKNPFDLVIANIIDGVLVQIQEDLKRLSSKFLILTGILNERESLFTNRFDFTGWSLRKKLIQNEWQGYLLERNES